MVEEYNPKIVAEVVAARVNAITKELIRNGKYNPLSVE